ncbi:hypothetical protein N7462_008970 [Penicillium macrosclerotiorum]|uniref:uncharacterized protein n=1 Tax=Penicillium macrosclerotiorum TaxID=303699 RepID=UPI002547BC1F|nr:uncharacterized protein N7462_008970 [Penicillium macrosclerotiorum]KAJ5676073.1 hypothetical protein N7462_008970 [Penicillium macrosclerotiorum]
MRVIRFFLLSTVALAAPQSSNCRCRPHDSCWPSRTDWRALNNTLNGNLVAVRPVASVCHKSSYDATACKAVTALWSDSAWRSSQPGAVQWENWEAWPQHHQACYVDSPRNSPCEQGRISLYSVKAQSTSDVQKAVQFASSHNLRLAIKNTGHDFLGRSTAPESLQILTHEMKDIEVVENFVPSGGSNGEGPAITIAAGVQLPEMYEAVAKHNRTVVGGSSHTVGAAGGYVQGGGHSPFGAWGGLGSDNALEFEVVTANGSVITVNAYQNSDLFWALRGGGGGTFGVVTSVTLRTFDEVPVVVYNLNITTAANDPHFWDAFSAWHGALPSLNDAGGSGYYFGFPIMPLDAQTSVSTIIALLMFPGKTDPSEIDQLFRPLTAKLQQISGVSTANFSLPLPTMNETIFTLLINGKPSDSTGSTALLASRLYSKDLLKSKDGPDRLANAWKSIAWSPYSGFTGHVVAGGTVAANADKVDSAVNPAWRKTVTHLLFSRGWETNATLSQQTAIIKNMTDVEIPILRSVEGADQMGAYLNEANGYEPGFEQSFWGNNYPRLYSIKQKWDPAGLFIARKGVGSEDWDDAGLCRTTLKNSSKAYEL